MENLKNKVQEIIDSKKAKGIAMMAQDLGVTHAQVIEVLDAKYAKVVTKDNFYRVWDFLTSRDSLTLLVISDGNIFEVKSKVVPGKEAQGYFNLFGSEPLQGHIKIDAVDEIALLSVPFMSFESHQIAFLNTKGHIMYSFYLSRDDSHKLLENDVNAFLALKEELTCKV